jgi:hypothetical protein
MNASDLRIDSYRASGNIRIYFYSFNVKYVDEKNVNF